MNHAVDSQRNPQVRGCPRNCVCVGVVKIFWFWPMALPKTSKLFSGVWIFDETLQSLITDVLRLTKTVNDMCPQQQVSCHYPTRIF